MEAVDVEPTDEAIDEWCGSMKIGSNTLKRDYAYYKDSIKKLEGAKEMMLQMQAAGKRNEAARLKKKADEAEKEAAEAAAAAEA